MSKDLTCSFCGKAQSEVKILVAGPAVYICDECVLCCYDIIKDHYPKCKKCNSLMEEPDESNLCKDCRFKTSTWGKIHERVLGILSVAEKRKETFVPFRPLIQVVSERVYLAEHPEVHSARAYRVTLNMFRDLYIHRDVRGKYSGTHRIPNGWDLDFIGSADFLRKQRLKIKRQDRPSQQVLAKEFGISVKRFSKIERGIIRDIDILEKLKLYLFKGLTTPVGFKYIN